MRAAGGEQRSTMGDLPSAIRARRLLRGAVSGSLATGAGGEPFASLVTPCATPDLSVLLLLSDLAAHTRQLAQAPRCALLVTGVQPEANPQTTPRLTVTGSAARVPAEEVPALRARYLARHPYAALYAEFADFALWRMTIEGGLLIGGFARAQRLRGDQMAPDPAAVAAVAAVAQGVLDHVNADHATAVALIAENLLRCGKGAWRLAGVDVDGCDLVAEDRTARLDFDKPVDNAGAIRAELVRWTTRAREAAVDGE
jgi:putative heme iron utilization protein